MVGAKERGQKKEEEGTKAPLLNRLEPAWLIHQPAFAPSVLGVGFLEVGG